MPNTDCDKRKSTAFPASLADSTTTILPSKTTLGIDCMSDLSILLYIVFIDFRKSAAKIQKNYEYIAECEKKEVLLHSNLSKIYI